MTTTDSKFCQVVLRPDDLEVVAELLTNNAASPMYETLKAQFGDPDPSVQELAVIFARARQNGNCDIWFSEDEAVATLEYMSGCIEALYDSGQTATTDQRIVVLRRVSRSLRDSAEVSLMRDANFLVRLAWKFGRWLRGFSER